MRYALIGIMLATFILLGILDLKQGNIATGIAAILLAVVNALLFLAGAKS